MNPGRPARGSAPAGALLGAVLACVPAPAGAGASRTVALQIEPADPFDLSAEGDWCRTFTQFQGVEAWDCDADLTPRAGTVAAPTDGIHEWFPSPRKQALCGHVEGLLENCFLGGFLAGECDLNHFVAPDEAWRALTRFYQCERPQDAQPRDPADALAPCHAATDHVEVEITPPPALRRFLRSGSRAGRDFAAWVKGSTWWRGHASNERLCAYGPWVLDTGHGNQPEIHPAQMLWWNGAPDGPRRAGGADGPFYLLLVQDASSRFDQHHAYRLDGPPARHWTPWAQAPVAGTFRVALSLSGQSPPPRLVLTDVLSVRRADPVVTSYRGDGRTLFTLEDHLGRPSCAERPSAPDRRGATDCASVSVAGRRLARLPDGTYRGFLVLSARVGRDEEWGEGFLFARLEVDARPAPASGASACQAPPAEAVLARARHKSAAQADTARVDVTWRVAPEDWRPVTSGDREALWQAFWNEIGWPEGARLLPHGARELRAARRIDLFAVPRLVNVLSAESASARVSLVQGAWDVDRVRIVDAASETVSRPVLTSRDAGRARAITRSWRRLTLVFPQADDARFQRIEVHPPGGVPRLEGRTLQRVQPAPEESAAGERRVWRHAWFPPQRSSALALLLGHLCGRPQAEERSCDPAQRRVRTGPPPGTLLGDLFTRGRADGLTIDELHMLVDKARRLCGEPPPAAAPSVP